MTDPDRAASVLPAWFVPRMMTARGAYGFLTTTGDVVRASRVTAVHLSSGGTILMDILLDRAGVPEGVDTAWQSKHFLGAPVTAATLATLNLAQVVMAVEFEVAELAETASGLAAPPGLDVAPATVPLPAEALAEMTGLPSP